jgi:tol-pal system protein YbgF
MKLKTILCGAVAAQLIFAGSVAAGGRTGSETQQLVAAGLAYMQLRQPQNKMRQPGPRNPDRAYVQLAQAALDPKVLELEEQIRQLNGQLEELNFQVLQMQDQMRKMQEDNEFRFQQLEGGSPAAGKKTEAAPAAAKTTDKAQAAGDGASIETIIAQPEGTNALPPQGGSADLGAPPQDLGRITFDANGNPVQTGAGALPGVETGPEAPDGTAVAALPPTDNPDELYRNSYEMVLSGDYAMAEAGFRDHIARFPNDPRAADAHFWLGESLLGQERYREAAQVFLEANRDYPDARKAPDAMLKLGMSLAAMNQRDVACATLAEVSKRYPKASPAILQRAKEERARASC